MDHRNSIMDVVIEVADILNRVHEADADEVILSNVDWEKIASIRTSDMRSDDEGTFLLIERGKGVIKVRPKERRHKYASVDLSRQSAGAGRR